MTHYQLPPVKRNLKKLVNNVSLLIKKSCDLENRLCRNNIRLMGILEQGLDPSEFLEIWLLNKLDKYSHTFICYRTGPWGLFQDLF